MMETGIRSPRSRLAICTTWIGPCLLLAGLSAGAVLAQTEEWPTASPESQGLSSAVIASYEDRVAAGEYGQVDSLLIVRRGFLVSEAYFRGWTAGDLHQAFSVTKSVTSVLVGIARERGEMPGLDSLLRPLLPQYPVVAHPGPAKDAITLDDVLTMRAGLEWNEFGSMYEDPRNPVLEMHASPDWLRFVLDLPMEVWPGTRYNYSTGYTILLAGVLRNTTGVEARFYAEDHLFSPLGIDEWYWNVGAKGLTDTGGGLSLRPRDMAKFGLLVLQGGLWQGQAVVSAGWVAESTAQHVDLGGGWGYGYQWRRMPGTPGDNSSFPFAWGWGGQFIFIVPALDMVVVSTASNYQNQANGALSFIRDLLRDARRPATGDLDDDGSADEQDLALFRQVLAGNIDEGEPPCRAPYLGDFNGNGRLDLADARHLEQLLSR